MIIQYISLLFMHRALLISLIVVTAIAIILIVVLAYTMKRQKKNP